MGFLDGLIAQLTTPRPTDTGWAVRRYDLLRERHMPQVRVGRYYPGKVTGEREKARRRRQIAKGMIKVEQP